MPSSAPLARTIAPMSCLCVLALALAMALAALPLAASAQSDTATPDTAAPGIAAGETPAETDEAAEAAEDAPEGAEEADAAPPADPLEGIDADTVVAEIDGTHLTLGELIAVRRALPAQYQALPGEVLLEGLTDQLVNQSILAERARAAGLDERKDLELTMINLQNSTLADAFMRQELQARLTESAVREAYEAQYVEAEPDQEIRASHILVETEDAAAELKAELDAGADFAELAAEHGTDGTAQNGGDLGWFIQGDMVPEFSNAAFALEAVDDVSAPVESPFGWHLIKLTGKRDRPAPDYEDVRDQILSELTEQAQRAILEEARAAAEVTRRDGDLPPEAVFADDLILPAE